MTPSEALNVLRHHCLAEDGKEPSASTFTKEQRVEGRSLSWWLNPMHKHERPPKGRARGMLKAYIEIADERFFATGIPVGDRYLLPDKGVMKALLIYGLVKLNSDKFIVTEVGRAFLSQSAGSRWDGRMLDATKLLDATQ